MEVKAKHMTDWSVAYKVALATEGKTPAKEPSPEWIERMLQAEHSPIRAKWYLLEFTDVPQYVFAHLTRHKHGVEWFIHSQRDDRRDNPVPRAQMPQGALNDGVCIINAQALINISRVRLCNLASEETQQLWRNVKTAVYQIDREMSFAMKPNCQYRGTCPEMRPCYKTK